MPNNKSKEVIYTEITVQENNFLTYCRNIKFGEINLVIMDGVPFKAKKAFKVSRFDIDEKEVL